MFIKYVTTKTAAVHLSEYKTIPELFLIFSRPVLISDGITLRRHLNELKVASSSSSSCKCLGASCYFPRDSFLFPVPFSTEFCRGGNLKAFSLQNLQLPVLIISNTYPKFKMKLKEFGLGFGLLRNGRLPLAAAILRQKKLQKKYNI